ncbi:PKD domain-containing protein [Marinifilum caeruleilacunae]|nr:PKD domain-containing protein [Marinifilum caeruleilacunae]
MRKILYLCILWLVTLPLMAQNQISEYEYWMDEDIANRQLVVLSSATSQVNISELLDINALNDGLHSIAIRFKDENNAWSSVVEKQFVKRTANTSSHQLSKIEYWFDNDIANAVTSNFAPTDQLDHSELIDLSALSNGLHLISYRIQDESKNWSSVVSKQFIIREASTSAQQLNTIQYWIDNDIENAVTNTFAASNQLNHSELIDLADLSDGVHLLSYRIKAESNSWSSVVSKQFIKREAIASAQQLNTIQYWFDNDIDNAVTNSFAATDQLNHSELIDVSGLSDGVHLLSYRIKAESNMWSSVVSEQFVKREENTQAHQLTKVQYWFDNDLENAVSINIASSDRLDMNELIDLSDLSDGLHTIHTRVMDESHIWSIVVSKQFVKRPKQIAAKLNQYRYWFNDDIANAKIVNIDPDAEKFSLNEQVDVLSIPPGADQSITYQFMDDQGKWTVPLSQTINRIAVVKAEFTADKTENCGPMSVQFTNNSSDGESYLWDFGDGHTSTEENPNHTYDTPGSYTVSLTTTNETYSLSDVSTMTDFISIHAIPSLDLGADIQICEGSEHTFSVADNYEQYFWNDASGTNEFTSGIAGDYTLRVVDVNGCEATDVVNLSFFTAPTVDLGVDIQICQGNEHTFSVADEFAQYFWNDVEGSNELIADAEGDYTLRVVDANGCEATDVVNLSFFTAPTVDLGADIQICQGNEHTFSVTDDFAQYFWNDVEGSNELIADTEGDYTLRVVDANGCEATDVVNLSFFTAPTVDLGADIQICQGNEHTFSVTDEFVQYFWNDVEGSNELIADAEGDYTLRVIDANGCEATDLANLSFFAAPIVDLGEDQTACNGEEVILSVEDNHNKYFWNNTEGSSQITVTATGEYQLRVVDNNGCEASDAVTVTFYDLPQQPVVSYEDGILASTYEEEYQWYLNDDILSGYTSQEFTPEQSGNYSVEVWNQYGCKSARSENVEVILVGIEDLIKENISIYPNPTKGKVVIDLSQNFDYRTNIQLKLFNASGQLLIQQNLHPITTIDLSSYSAGLYFIHFLNQGEIVSFKIIKQ